MENFYVSISGDDNNIGDEQHPFKTIITAINKITTNEAHIYVDVGEYEINNIQQLSKNNSTVSIEGVAGKTIFIVNNPSLYEGFKGNANFIKIIFAPNNAETNRLCGSGDEYTINYYNCVFKKSENGLYPSSHFFENNVRTDELITNKNYYNCSFDGDILCIYRGNSKLYNCVTTNNKFISVNGITTDCITNVSFNQNYIIYNTPNRIYGVYSGQYRWMKILLKSNNKYYSIKEKYYNSETKEYTPVSNINLEDYFEISDLFKEITVQDETFKPINKFKTFSIISLLNTKCNFFLSGNKTSSTLFTANGDIDISLANSIKSLFINAKMNKSVIKVAISTDSGKTWNTSISNKLTPLDIVIPQKKYNDFTKEEKIQYENAKNEILKNGIDIELFNIQDFNELFYGKKIIRLAYAIQLLDNVDSVCEIDKLTLNFDAKGSMHKMSDDEVTIDVYEHSILITSLINSGLIKTNIIF